MPSILNVMVSAITVALFVTGIYGATPDIQAETQAALKKAANEIQVEISLGQLAAQRARNEQVQEFGQHMAEDHKKASQQVELLAIKQGVPLSSDNRNDYRSNLNKKLEELSGLSGYAFDREYMDYSIRDHEIIIEELRRQVGIIRNQDIKQWILLILPILESHREKAHRVKYSLQTNP